MAVYSPTATFKEEHDGVGNLDKKVIRQVELFNDKELHAFVVVPAFKDTESIEWSCP